MYRDNEKGGSLIPGPTEKLVPKPLLKPEKTDKHGSLPGTTKKPSTGNKWKK